MTPLQLTALAGILQNKGIEPNANGILSIAKYEAVPTISNLVLSISRAQALRYDPANVSNTVVSNIATSVSNAAITQITTIGASTVPALGDSLPTTTKNANIGNISLNTYAGLSGYAIFQAFQIATPTDLGKFCQKFTSAVGYVKQTNEIIATSQNTNFLGPTFSGMDNLTTGGFNGVSTSLSKFGQDLGKLGNLINFAALGEFGSPVGLVRQLIASGGLLPGFIGAVEGINVEQTANGGIVVSIDALNGLTLPGSELSDTVQSLLYKAMQRVTGTDLAEVLAVLKVTTANIKTMADLLNPVKIFPNSYTTLLAPVPTVTGTPDPTATRGLPPNREYIYINQSGSINTSLATKLPPYLVKLSESTAKQITYERLRTIVPADQALGSKAIEASFEQIKNIDQQNCTQLAATVSTMELNSGLPLIQNMTQPVPNSVVTSLSSTIPKGTGPNGTITLFDVLGVVSGSTQANLDNVTGNIVAINTSALNDVYNVMAKMLNGDYNVYANGLTGSVTSVTVTSAGSGYTYVPTLLFTGGSPTVTAVATVNMSGNLAAGTGTVSNVTIVTGGSNYQSVPTVKPSGGSATFTASLLGNAWVAIDTPYGNYAPNYSNALANLCTVANAAIVTIRTSNAARVANINSNWSAFANSLAYQANSLQKAGITEGNVSSAQTPVVMSFVDSLHEYGLDTSPGGAVDYLTLVTEPNTLTGQAIRACLREGRNLKLLQDSGIGSSSQIPK